MQLSYRPVVASAKSTSIFKRNSTSQVCNRTAFRCKAERSGPLVGEDFGARDPTAGELASNFSDKVLGNWDTEHIIKPPERIGEIVGLKTKTCSPLTSDTQPLEESDINRLRLQCAGWRVIKNDQNQMSFTYEWKVRSAEAGKELIARVQAVADEQGHQPKSLSLQGEDTVIAELMSAGVGGLTLNDMIIAARVNDLEFGDLMQKRKPKFWA